MSRETASNDRYEMAFGVDHTPTGCFFQLYEKAAVGEDAEADGMRQPQIEGNETFGVRVNNTNTLDRNRRLSDVLRPLGLEDKKKARLLRNEETIIAIGKACGLDIAKAVYELWD